MATNNCINSSSSVVQVVSTSTGATVNCTGTFTYNDTLPQNTGGTEIITLSITPKYSTSTLEIIYTSMITGTSAGSTPLTLALFQDTTANALNAQSINSGSSSLQYPGFIRHIMTSGTTSSTTFKIRLGSTVNPAYNNAVASGTNVFGGVASTSLIIIEHI